MKDPNRMTSVLADCRKKYKLALKERKKELKLQAWISLEEASNVNATRAYWQIINHPLCRENEHSRI